MSTLFSCVFAKFLQEAESSCLVCGVSRSSFASENGRYLPNGGIQTMEAAIEAVKIKAMTVRTAADFFSVPKSTLHDRLAKATAAPQNDESHSRGRPTVLTRTEENGFVGIWFRP